MLETFDLASQRIIESPPETCSVMVFANPTESEKRYLIDGLLIDEHTLNSALDPDELSRLEFEPDHIAIIYKRPENYSGEGGLLFQVTSSGFFLFKEKLVIVLAEPLPLFEGKAMTRIGSLKEVMLKIIGAAIAHYLGHLKVINKISEELEKKINAAMENRYLINLFTLEKSLVYYLNSINANGMLIEKLKMNTVKIGLNSDEIELLDDIYIENQQCYRQAEIYSNILASMMDARASIVANNLNLLMKTLTIITIGIMVPTFVVSAFSMNVPVPFGEKYAEDPFGFWFVIGFAALALVFLGLFIRMKKW